MTWNYPVPIGLYLAAALLLVLLALRPLWRIVDGKVIFMVIAALFIVGMILLPSENHLMGDGITHLNSSQRIFSPTEPLDVFLHYLVGQIFGSMLASYRVIAFVAGLFYILGLYLLAGLGNTVVEKGIIVSSFLAMATVQFYFGYVESYTLLNLFLLFYIYFAWRDYRVGQYSYLPLLFFLLAVVSHFSAVMLLPSLIYFYRRRFGKTLIYLVLLMVAAAVVVAWQVKIGIIMVPLMANSFSAYSLFSAAHLHDLLRELLLVSPAFFLAACGRRFDAPVRFALLALAGALAFTVLVDPKFGAFRDWDLLSLFALPLAFLIALRAPHSRLTVMILAVAVAVRVVPWLIFNHSLQVDFANKVVHNDIHYSQKYDNGYRLRSWGVFLKEVGDYTGAADAFSKRLEYQPDDIRALNMLIPTLFKLGEYQEALSRCVQGLRLEPHNTNFLYKAIYTAFRSGNLSEALRLWDSSPTGFKSSAEVARLYAGILAAQGYNEQAVHIARQYPAEDSDGYLPYMLARSFAAVGDSSGARSLIQSALRIDSTNSTYRAFADSLASLDMK